MPMAMRAMPMGVSCALQAANILFLKLVGNVFYYPI